MSAPSLVLLALALAADPAAPPPAASPPPASRRASPEVHALVARCVEAYGGSKAVVRMARIREQGTVTSEVLHGGAAGRLTRVYQRPGRLRVEIAYPGAPAEVRVLDGGRGWRFGQEVQGPLLVSMILQSARLDLPSLLAAWEDRIVDEGAFGEGANRLHVLALEVAPGVRVEAAIDPATGRILRSRGTGQGAMPLEFITSYSDFRTVDGVLVAFREGNYANGHATGETVLEKVDFPGAVPDPTFRP